MDKELLDGIGELLFKGLVVAMIFWVGKLRQDVQTLKQEVSKLKDELGKATSSGDARPSPNPITQPCAPPAP